MVIEIKVVNDLSDMMDIEAKWDQLANLTSKMPMQEFIWSMPYYLKQQDKNISLLTVFENRELIAAAPYKCGLGFFTNCSLLMNDFLGEPGDFIYKNEKSLQQLLARILETKKPFLISRILADSPTVSYLKHNLNKKAVVVKNELQNYPFIELKYQVDENSLISKRLRSDLRRAQRHAELMGKVEFEIYSPSTEKDFLSLFDKFLKIESAGWKGYDKTAVSDNKIQKHFFKCYGLKAVKKNVLRIAFLRIDSEYVATQFAIQSNDKFWLLKIGHDEKYNKASPGKILMFKTLTYALRQGLDSYEFLGSSDKWTQSWTKKNRQTVAIRIYPISVNSLVSLSLYTFKKISNNIFYILWKAYDEKFKAISKYSHKFTSKKS